MKDRFEREIRYLRISVTDKCNNRCRYCMPEEGVCDLGHEGILSFEGIQRIVRTAADLGIRKYRLTGGEPLVRKGIVSLVDRLARIPGVEELAMTTNGILLSRYAAPLKRAGLNRVNISLDSLREDRYREITRGGRLDHVLEGIAAAEAAGLAPVKLNAVIMKGFNEDEIPDFAALTMEKPYEVRFIELMPIGEGMEGMDYGYLPAEEMKKYLPDLIPAESGNGRNAASRGVAEVHRLPEARGTVGFISPISSHFCGTCDKIRMTSDGKLKTCLHSEQEIDLRSALKDPGDGSLRQVLEQAVRNKEERHRLAEGAGPIRRNMNRIGG